MYKKLSKDELIVAFFTVTFALLYRILEDYKIWIISARTVVIFLMTSAAYLCFNRTIKMLIEITHNKYYSSFFIVYEIKDMPVGENSYKYFIVHYTDCENNKHIKEIHSSFSIRKWKKGDKIKIKISKNDPEIIIIPFSDISMAVIMTLMGILFEFILFMIYININIY